QEGFCCFLVVVAVICVQSPVEVIYCRCIWIVGYYFTVPASSLSVIFSIFKTIGSFLIQLTLICYLISSHSFVEEVIGAVVVHSSLHGIFHSQSGHDTSGVYIVVIDNFIRILLLVIKQVHIGQCFLIVFSFISTITDQTVQIR